MDYRDRRIGSRKNAKAQRKPEPVALCALATLREPFAPVPESEIQEICKQPI